MKPPNAIVDYVDAKTGEVVESVPFYDPGLDPESALWRVLIKESKPFCPALTYACGRPMSA